MVDQLYVARGHKRSGPFSAAQLREFAAGGRLRPTDTVWKEGMERAVPAAKVKNLFAAPQDQAPPPDAVVLPSPPPAPPDAPPMPAESGPAMVALPNAPAAPPAADQTPQRQAVPNTPPPLPKPEQARKRRAVGLKGVVLVSQDGVSVHYRKKCVQCGFEDACRSTMLIGQGVSRALFYCPKCRKSREVQIQGMMQ